MSIQISFGLPTVAVIRQVGTIVIKHGQLDHVQKLVLKRLLNISIHDRRYIKEVHGLMSKDLRKEIATRLKSSKLDQATKCELRELLTRARRVSTQRNKLVHGVWCREVPRTPRSPRKPFMLRDGRKAPEPILSVVQLKRLACDMDVIRDRLNSLTRPLL